jgi:hypothetical protein
MQGQPSISSPIICKSAKTFGALDARCRQCWPATMGTKVREPQLSADRTKVNVRIDIEGQYFTATFLRHKDGTLSDPAMHVGGLDRPDKAELERRFWDEAHRVKRERAAEILALLEHPPEGPHEDIKRRAHETARKARERAQPAVNAARAAAADIRAKLGLPKKS